MQTPSDTTTIPLDALPPISLDKFMEQSGISPTTCWRHRKKGWLQTIVIANRHYVTRDAIAEFNKRAAAGEFAGNLSNPSASRSAKLTNGGIIPEAFQVGKTARVSREAVKASLDMKCPDLGRSKRSIEDIVRLAFTMIDHELFPSPSWMLFEKNMDPRDTDHARRMADQYRKAVEDQNSTTLKLAYFQGVLDWAAMMEAEGETVPGFEEPMATR